MTDNDLVKRLAWSGMLAGIGALASIVTTRVAAVVFRRVFGEDIAERAGLLGNELDHPADHVLRIQSHFGFIEQTVGRRLERCAGGEVDAVVEPAVCGLDHRLIEACEKGPRIDGLHLDAERP